MSFIEIRNLCHRFPDGTLGIDGIDLSIEKGEFVVIAGKNGSGKTTLLRHLNGLLTPSNGEVILDGMSVGQDPRRARRIVGMVFQDADSQIVGETVYEDAAFGPENLKLDREAIRQRVVNALAVVALERLSEQRPHILSGGEKRRLAIAGVLAMEPEVVVFDEPFSNLDYDGIRQVLTQMLTLHKVGKTLLVTTHDLEKVITHADRLVILFEGEVVRNGAPADLLEETENFGVRQPCAARLGGEVPSWLD
ncbi:ATPase component BioM of energizing module of biotin ECF transporter [Olavius algarvensis associated proteobacterium Delta 3]|nr:ATPase component BioM of energizing module of biotin ECF transporter [Olavius algarvensis associated proteobacterium Delta 3]